MGIKDWERKIFDMTRKKEAEEQEVTQKSVEKARIKHEVLAKLNGFESSHEGRAAKKLLGLIHREIEIDSGYKTRFYFTENGFAESHVVCSYNDDFGDHEDYSSSKPISAIDLANVMSPLEADKAIARIRAYLNKLLGKRDQTHDDD
ncbi:MAG: hypothetical protein HZA94_01700 [Candidatus Vogelbacteria bacterium]|nr:hypothetical protein [Candidatus Vogelbacteria bacterium]